MNPNDKRSTLSRFWNQGTQPALDIGAQREGLMRGDTISLPPVSNLAPFDPYAFADTVAAEMLSRVEKRVIFNAIPFSVGATVQRLRPEEDRYYFIIQNTHPTNFLYIGFGYEPNQATGLSIGPNGYYEPLWVPQNEIYLLANNASTTGIILYATSPKPRK